MGFEEALLLLLLLLCDDYGVSSDNDINDISDNGNNAVTAISTEDANHKNIMVITATADAAANAISPFPSTAAVAFPCYISIIHPILCMLY